MTSIKTKITIIFVSFLVACSSVTSGPEPVSPDTYSGSLRPLLNSERIRQEFGSYGIEVVTQDDRLRVSNLYSLDMDARTMRTLAVVFFPETIPSPLQEVHKEIIGGHSIGETFKKNGWKVEKRNLYFGEVDAAAEFDGVYAAMGEIAAVNLAVHIYQLYMRKDNRWYLYATIAEIHHPDYLDLTGLQAIYGSGMMAPGLTRKDLENALDAVIGVMKRFGEK